MIEKLEPTKSPKYKIRVLLRGEDLFAWIYSLAL